MTDQLKRTRIRLDIPGPLLRGARARAGFDGTDMNAVVAAALEVYLVDELATLRKKQSTEKKDGPSSGKK